LKKWIVAAKKNEKIFVEVDLDWWDEEGEKKNYNHHIPCF
jgi:hypothetical protein